MTSKSRKVLIAAILIIGILCSSIALMASYGVIQNVILGSKVVVLGIVIMVASLLLYYFRENGKPAFLFMLCGVIPGAVIGIWIV